ncbi:MAG: ABC transporter ATP-binding protein [Deltaproteobacteria bacterium]|nr:ABC transporter ATP-binding protein [Deltaproteobacteria bacterium]
MTVLEIKNLVKSFGGILALRDVSFNVESNTILGIIGPNGSGKTTFFNLVTGFLRPNSGQIIYEGKDLTWRPSYQIASLGVVRTYQMTSLFDNLTVEENIRIATHTKTKTGLLDAILKTANTRRDRLYVEERVNDLLSFTKLTGKEREIASSLSYGNQRKLEIAIALAAEPRILLLDEPAAGMNRSETDDLAELVRELKSKYITVLIVDHNMKLIMDLCDRIVVLDHGVKLAEDIPKNIISNSEVIKVYFGEELEFA